MREKSQGLRLVGYARVSVEEKVTGGYSLPDQAGKLRMYAELHAHELVNVIVDDGVSAKSLKRPGWQEIQAMLDARTIDGVLINKLDRLTRNLDDWRWLIRGYFAEQRRTRRGTEAGLILASVQDHVDTATATGRLMLNLIFTVAEWEREAIAERVKAGMAQKIRQGEWTGKVWYGWDPDPAGPVHKKSGKPMRIVPNVFEQAAICDMRRWRAEGASYRGICERLKAAGVATKEGRADWDPTTVRTILKRTVA